VEVYFDDFRVTHVKSPVIQTDDYYPFGLSISALSYQRENSTAQDYKYNGKELQEELGLGWLDYGARMYMPDIGRWGVVDPWAQKYYEWSPYNYAFDNPVNLSDFMGLGPNDPKGMTETQIYSADQEEKEKVKTFVTAETRSSTTIVNDDGSSVTTSSRSITTNIVTKDIESGKTTTEAGKTNTETTVQTIDKDGNKSSTSTSETTNADKSSSIVQKLNEMTDKISNFNSTHEKTYNQTIASDANFAMGAAVAANVALFLPAAAATLAGNAQIGYVAMLEPVGAGLAPAPLPGFAAGMISSAKLPGYVHGVSQSRIANGRTNPTVRTGIFRR
jgi:RHS repeat-associated protein